MEAAGRDEANDSDPAPAEGKGSEGYMELEIE